MATDIFLNKELLAKLDTIEDQDENLYSDVPGWEGQIDGHTNKAIQFIHQDGTMQWFPISQLRIAGDAQSIYASNWFLNKLETEKRWGKL